MTNKKRKGFTIVELVIVIAVIAILAGVLIPTFASIIDKANQSSDIQAVRQMNVLLKAESVDKTLSFNNVIEIVSEAGYDTVEKRTPKSSGHGFYWHSDTNTIILVKTTNPAELIYPLDNEELRNAFDDKKADWANNHDGFEDLAVKVEPGEGGDEPTVTPDGTAIENLGDLKVALQNGGNYYLAPSNGNKIIVNETITATTTVIIDLNGNTLMIGDPEDSTVNCEFEIRGQLTITNSNSNSGKVVFNSVANSGYGGFYVIGGTLNLNGVNVEGNRLYNIYDSGDGAIYNFTNITYTVNGDGHAIYSSSSTSATIKGSTLSRTFSGENAEYLINWTSSGLLTLENVTIGLKEGEVYERGVNAENGTVAINGGTYNCNLELYGASATFDNGTYNGLVTCKNGTVSSGEFNGGFKVVSDGKVTISGGKFTKTVQLYGSNFTTLNIKGGEFIANSTEDIIIEAVEHGEINITGGKFQGKIKMTWKHDNPQSYIHIFNYNPTDPNVTYPMFYYKDTTTGEEKYTSFFAAGYCNSTNIIIVQQPGYKKAIDNTWVIANTDPGTDYSPDTPTE